VKSALVTLLVVGLTAGTSLSGAPPARAFAAEETASEYSVFYSPPERLEALLWAIVDCYPVRDLAEAKERFLAAGGAEWDHWQNGWTKDIDEMGLRPDEGKLAALEAEFGDMPEYWQARCFFEWADTRESNVGYLERACDVAPDDPASMYFLADAKRALAESIMEDVEDPFAEQLKRRQVMRDAAEVMVSCAEREPQNAFYFYEAAFIIRKLGEYERVTELLRLGNSAPVNENVQLFPESYIVRNLREIRERDDGSGKFRLLAFALMYTPLPEYIERRHMIKEYQVMVSVSGDVELLNVPYVFACRYGQQQYSKTIQQLVAVVLVGLIADMPGEIGAISLDRDTLYWLSDIGSLRGAVRGLVLGSTVWREFLRDEGYTDILPVKSDVFEMTPEDIWEQSTSWWEAQLMEYLYLGPQTARQFRILGMYRYHDDGTITRGADRYP